MATRAKPEPGKSRVPMMVRIAPQVRERLENAAQASGRSLAQEVELRLDRSFEITSMVEVAAKTTAEMAQKFNEDSLRQLEQHMLAMIGGDNLYVIWSVLAVFVHEAERETGKSIREDEFTKNLAERKLLGAIPGIFRNLPGTYSDFKERALSRGPGILGDLSANLGAKIEAPLPPLGWTGPWPPTDK